MAAMLEQLEREDLGLMDRMHIEFALGKAFEYAQDHARSFEHYDAGHSLKRRQTRYNADQMHAEMIAQKTVRTPELFAHGEERAGPPQPIRSSSSAFRARDRPCSNRSLPATARSTARSNCPITSHLRIGCGAARRANRIIPPRLRR